MMEESERILSSVKRVEATGSRPPTKEYGEAKAREQIGKQLMQKLVDDGGDVGTISPSVMNRGEVPGDTQVNNGSSEVEQVRALCEPERRQVTSTTVLPLAGRPGRYHTSRQTVHTAATATTELSNTPGVAISTGRKKGNRKLPGPKSDSIVIQYNDRYLKSCPGIFRLLQVTVSMICLISLTTSGSGKYSSYLLLPLSWHFRVMVFVLVLSILTSLCLLTVYTTGLYSTFPLNWPLMVSFLTSLCLLTVYTTGLYSTFPLNWPLMDLVLYGMFTFFYLVSSSLVASAFDFYQQMGTDVPPQTIRRLILCVVLGYMAMFLYLATAVHGYKKWRWLEMHQFRRQRLMEADEIA